MVAMKSASSLLSQLQSSKGHLLKICRFNIALSFSKNINSSMWSRNLSFNIPSCFTYLSLQTVFYGFSAVLTSEPPFSLEAFDLIVQNPVVSAERAFPLLRLF